MAKLKHLFVALSRSGWGETSLGLEVARQVGKLGDTVSFIAHSRSLPALSGTRYEVREISDHSGPLSNLVFDDCLNTDDFSSIVLCDFLTTNYTLKGFGLEPERILQYDVPVITLDTWEYDTSGPVVDVLGSHQWEIGTWIEQVKRRLVPVPIGRLTSPGAYCGLPSPLKITRGIRRHIRRNLGVADSDRTVLFCTAGWQHGTKDPNGQRLAASVPQLLWNYISSIDPAVRLIHIGPSALPIKSDNDRYLWTPAMAPENFDRLLGSVDLVLSANISATTISRAMALGVPVVVVQNSCSATTAEEVEGTVGAGISPMVREWLKQALPLYPFVMWPLGFWRFLKPVLQDNPYCSAIELVELLDEPKFIETCRSLLFDAKTREKMVERQAAYMAQVKALPTAAELIHNYLQ